MLRFSLSFLLLYPFTAFAGSAPAPIGLQVDFRADTPVVDGERPRLSWRLPLREGDAGWTPVSRRLQVAGDRAALLAGADGVWDSGELPGAEPWLDHPGPPPEPGADAWWRVRVRGADGITTGWSEPARWIRGPGAAHWSEASWIGARPTRGSGLPPHTRRDVLTDMVPAQLQAWDEADRLASRSILLRRAITLPAAPVRAVAFLSGLGQYELSVNGAPAETGRFQPAWSDYDRTVFYNAVDLTDRLAAGENVVGVQLGNGFFTVAGDRYAKFLGSFGAPRLLLRLEVTCADGSRHVVVSDESWRWSESPITFTCIFGGEDHDARLERAGWDSPGFDAADWPAARIVEAPAGRLRAQPTPGLAVTLSYPVVEHVEVAPGVTRLDFGQNLAGFPDLVIDGPAGATLTFHGAEALTPEGRTTQAHVQNNSRPPRPDTVLRYTADGRGPASWRPRFHYYGYRWAEISGDARLVEARSNFLQLDVPTVGSFASSNATINGVHDLIVAAIRSNLQHVLTDCPHREKLGWLEVFHLLGPSILYNFEAASLIRKVTRDMMDAQEGSGLVPNTAPEYAVFSPIFRDSPEWGASMVLLPWLHHQWYGDPRLLEEAYPAMVRFTEYLRSRRVEGLVRHGLGDWGDQGPGEPGVSKLTSPGVTGTAIFHECLRVLAATARVLGRPAAEATRFEAIATHHRGLFNQRFFDASAGHYDRGSQTAQAMPLVLGLATGETAPSALAALQRNLAAGGHLPTAGDIGLRYVVEALADAGDSEAVFQLVTHDDGPGYAYQLRAGMTTLAEAWDVHPWKSRNHCMLGHVEQWFYSHLAGLRPDPAAPGWRRFFVAPETVGDLAWVRASFEAPGGVVASSWEIRDGVFTLDVTVPPGAVAEVILPRGIAPRFALADGREPPAGAVRPLPPATPERARFEATGGAYRFTQTAR